LKIVRTLFKSFLLSPTNKKWNAFKDFYRLYYTGKENLFDEAVDFVSEFYQESRTFPNFNAINTELTSTQETSLQSFFKEVENDDGAFVSEESEYFAQVKAVEKSVFEMDLYRTITDFNSHMATLDKKDMPTYLKSTEAFIANIHKIRDVALRTSENTSGILYGESARQDLEDTYKSIIEKKNSEEALFYSLEWKKLDKVKICRGDLVIIGGFTSHGKSILLRNIVYRLAVEYGLNCFYSSLEMSYETIKILFNILHANNKRIFPGTPMISYEKFREGLLTEEEADFLFNVAAKDFVSNENYGTLYMEYPNKSRYTLSDIKTKITELENTVMPVHVMAVDYLTLLYPLDSQKGKPDREDYNRMIKEFKSMALSHRSSEGKPAPMIALTPAQISRGKLEEAVKNNHYYDLSALREYTELEASADIVLTTMLLPEMRQSKTIKIQHLKNRNGDLDVDPQEFFINLDYGFNITETVVQSTADRIQALKSIVI